MKGGILDEFDLAVEKLMENDVKPETKIVATVSPWVKTLLRKAYVQLDTDNSEMIKNGYVGRYYHEYTEDELAAMHPPEEPEQPAPADGVATWDELAAAYTEGVGLA